MLIKNLKILPIIFILLLYGCSSNISGASKQVCRELCEDLNCDTMIYKEAFHFVECACIKGDEIIKIF